MYDVFLLGCLRIIFNVPTRTNLNWHSTLKKIKTLEPNNEPMVYVLIYLLQVFCGDISASYQTRIMSMILY